MNAVGQRDTSETEESGEVSHRNKSHMTVGTGAVVGKSIDKAFQESCCGPALAAPRDRDVPCFSPWTMLDSSTLDGNDMRRDAQAFFEANKHNLGDVDDDCDNAHGMTNSPDPSRRFKHEVLRVPSGLRWDQRSFQARDVRLAPRVPHRRNRLAGGAVLFS